MAPKPGQEQAYCIGCGEPVSSEGWGSECKNKKCKGKRLNTVYVRCLSTKCKGEHLLRKLCDISITRCPKCGEEGQFAEVE